MRFFTTLATVAAMAMALPSAFAQNATANTNKPLPFDGRCQSLTTATIDKTYMLHIFKQRPNNTVGNPADYLSVEPKGRSPAYNGDTGVVTVAVDDKAIFKEMYNFRRSELVQMIAGNPTGTTFFRASIRADEPIQNKYQWQAFFPESHVFDVYIDFKVSPPKLQFLADSWTLQYETEFKYKTWTNVGVAVESTGLITFYASEGDAPLKKVYTTKKALATDKIPADYELHFGMLLYSETPNPKMVADHQDKLMFSGVTVDKVGLTADSDAAADSGAAPAPAAGAGAGAGTAPAPAAPATTPKPAAGNAPVKCKANRK